MTQPGYQEGSDRVWWWKVAQHLDDAQRALANAMAHNVDDPSAMLALQDKIREAQAILLVIFRSKRLLPPAMNGTTEAPKPTVVEAVVVTAVHDAAIPTVADAAVVAAVISHEAASQASATAAQETSAVAAQEPAPATAQDAHEVQDAIAASAQPSAEPTAPPSLADPTPEA